MRDKNKKLIVRKLGQTAKVSAIMLLSYSTIVPPSVALSATNYSFRDFGQSDNLVDVNSNGNYTSMDANAMNDDSNTGNSFSGSMSSGSQSFNSNFNSNSSDGENESQENVANFESGYSNSASASSQEANNDTKAINGTKSYVKEVDGPYNRMKFYVTSQFPSELNQGYPWYDGTFYLLIDGNQPAFCVQPGPRANGSIGSGSDSVQGAFSKYSPTQQKKMQMFASYAMLRYEQTSNEDYLYAGQAMVWDAGGLRLDNNSIPSALRPIINELRTLVDTHYDIPSFMGQDEASAPKYSLKWDESKNDYEILLTDSKNVWENKWEEAILGSDRTEVIGDYTLDGTGAKNTVLVSTTNEEAAEQLVSGSFKGIDGTPSYFARPNSQDFMTAGSIDEVDGHFKVNVEKKIVVDEKGKGHFDKVDADTNAELAGAQFGLYSDEAGTNLVAKSNVTTENGDVIFEDLDAGEYFVKEIQAPTGYELNPKTYPVTVVAGEDTEWFSKNNGDFEDKKIEVDEKGKGHFDKVDADTNGELAGAQFGLYSDKDATMLVAKSNVTTDNGDVKFENVKAGDYFVKEIQAPKGYELDAKAYPVTVVAGKDTEWFSKNDGDFEDKKIEVDDKGKAHFDKVDAQTGKELAGAQFGLYTDKETTNLVAKSNVTTDDGVVRFEDVPAGKYFVKEIVAPDGYELNPHAYLVRIFEGKDTEWFCDNDGDFEDKKIAPKEGKGHFNKVDSETHEDLSGAQFGLYSDKDATQLVAKSNVTGEDGFVDFETVPEGTYYVKEIKAPNGYTLDTKSYKVKVVAGEDREWFRKNDGEFSDEVIKGKIDLNKVEKASDLNPEQNPLKGAEFTIYEDTNANGKLDDGENEVQTIVTNKKGFAESEDLAFGTYVVRETKAPEGYELLNKDFAAKINSDATVHLNNGNPIEDAHVQGKKIIDKVDEYGNAVAGAKFGVFKPNGEQVDELVTDENGHAETIMLDYGKYYLQELEAPEGYDFDPELKIDFTIGSEKEDKGGKPGHIEVLNDLIEGYIELHKVDADSNVDLSGAEFTIFKDVNNNKEIDQGETVDKVKTSWDGSAKSEKLPYGEYSVLETKAPEGYELNETVYSISIDENKKVYEQTVEDEKSEPTCPKIVEVEDKNNNGKLDEGENTTDLPDECVVLKPEVCPEIVGVIDTNNNGKLDEGENTTDLPDECVVLTPETCPEIKEVTDTNNNGKLDEGENTTGLPDECVVLIPETCPEIKGVTDTNNNGKLDDGENTTGLPDECVVLTPETCPEIKEVTDTNNNGKLDEGENTTNLPDECVVLTPETCPEIKGVTDTNNNGKLDEGENTTDLPDECVVLTPETCPEIKEVTDTNNNGKLDDNENTTDLPDECVVLQPEVCPEIKGVTDTNNNGKLDEGENTTNLPDECVVLTPETCPEIKEVTDTNNNGKIDKDENTTNLPDECVVVSPNVCPEIKEVTDLNKNGKLDKDENTTGLPDECVKVKFIEMPETGKLF